MPHWRAITNTSYFPQLSYRDLREQISGTQQHGCLLAGWVPDKREALSGMTNSPLSVSPALRRDKANALRSPRSRPKRGAQGAGVSCGWLRALAAGDPGMRQGCGVWE